MKPSTSDTPGLLSLAPELVQAIGYEMEMSDVKQLRLTCRAMAGLLQARIFRTVNLAIFKNNMQDGVNKVESLSTATHPACRAARQLSIGTLAPAYTKSSPFIGIYGVRRVTTPTADNPTEVAIAEAKLIAHLFDAIISFRSVHTVRWIPNEKDGQSVHRIVMHSLKNLPNLRRVIISFCKFETPLVLDSLRGLQGIDISAERTSPLQQENILDNIAKLIALNPDLTSIDLSTIQHYGTPKAGKSQSLHQLFKYCSSTSPLLLRNLKLKSCLVRLDELTMPHLKYLTSLSLLNVDDPFCNSSFRYGFGLDDQTDLGLIQERKHYGSRPDDIWRALIAAKVHLTEIHADVVPQSFLDYLSSYSGLIELHLELGGFMTGTSSDAMAVLFFEGGLDSHSQSLENLQIRAQYEGLWCFGSHNYESISRLTRLKSLGLSIRSMNLEDYFETKDRNLVMSNSDAIKQLVDMAVFCMSNIEHIHVDPASLECYRNAMCGTGKAEYLDHIYKRLKKSAMNYIAPSLCKRIPSLTVGVGKTLFTAERTSLSHSNVIIERYASGETEEAVLRYVDRTPKNQVLGWCGLLLSSRS